MTELEFEYETGDEELNNGLQHWKERAKHNKLCAEQASFIQTDESSKIVGKPMYTEPKFNPKDWVSLKVRGLDVDMPKIFKQSGTQFSSLKCSTDEYRKLLLTINDFCRVTYGRNLGVKEYVEITNSHIMMSPQYSAEIKHDIAHSDFAWDVEAEIWNGVLLEHYQGRIVDIFGCWPEGNIELSPASIKEYYYNYFSPLEKRELDLLIERTKG